MLIFLGGDNITNLKPEADIEEVRSFLNSIAEILRDPQRIAHFLSKLDRELGQEVQLPEIAPANLITGCGHFIPGLWPTDYVSRQKGDALSKLLLRHEIESGINLERVVLRLVGAVDSSIVDPFIAEGRVFDEDEMVGRLLLHGKYSHRLMFEVIREAIAEAPITMPAGYDNFKDLFALFVNSRIEPRFTSHEQKIPVVSVWQTLLDETRDRLACLHLTIP